MNSPLHSRRSFLRATGVTLFLPYLESLGWRAFAASSVVQPPIRFGFIYTPNGYHQATFTPATAGANWEVTPTLEPLAGLRNEITICTGLDRAFVPGTGVHAQCGSCWLTSSPPTQTLDGGFPTNISLDQVIARQIGQQTALPSLELSANNHTDNRETKYFESISWYGPGHAANTEKNPRAVFQRLFGQAQGGNRRSVLDTVLEDAKSLRGQLGRADQQKLDEYLNSVRETERRIQLAEVATVRIGRPPIAEPQGIPQRRDEYLRTMGDLMVLAFQNDLTRVATLLVDPERWDSPRIYHGVFETPQNHHVLTHTKGEEAKQKLTKIDRFHMAQFAYVLEKLKAIPEGEGTLLDHCAITMGSGISDGDSHNYHDLQVIMAGRAGGALKPGAHHHFDGEVPLANLWLTLAQLANVKLERFADSTHPLKEVLA